jgi:hypothetical protein
MTPYINITSPTPIDPTTSLRLLKVGDVFRRANGQHVYIVLRAGVNDVLYQRLSRIQGSQDPKPIYWRYSAKWRDVRVVRLRVHGITCEEIHEAA